jgi:hypothetical protein
MRIPTSPEAHWNFVGKQERESSIRTVSHIEFSSEKPLPWEPWTDPGQHYSQPAKDSLTDIL